MFDVTRPMQNRVWVGKHWCAIIEVVAYFYLFADVCGGKGALI